MPMGNVLYEHNTCHIIKSTLSGAAFTSRRLLQPWRYLLFSSGRHQILTLPFVPTFRWGVPEPAIEGPFISIPPHPRILLDMLRLVPLADGIGKDSNGRPNSTPSPTHRETAAPAHLLQKFSTGSTYATLGTYLVRLALLGNPKIKMPNAHADVAPRTLGSAISAGQIHDSRAPHGFLSRAHVLFLAPVRELMSADGDWRAPHLAAVRNEAAALEVVCVDGDLVGVYLRWGWGWRCGEVWRGSSERWIRGRSWSDEPPPRQRRQRRF